MDVQRMRTSRQQLIEEPTTLADRTMNGGGADDEPGRKQALEDKVRLDAATAALISLAEAGIPTDVQELLIVGDPSLGIAPGSLSKAIATVIRALSSPVHADAGKVEGDGKKWPMREIVAKAIAYHSVGDPHAKTIRGDQRWEWFLEEADKFISVFGYYLPALPPAPASEGAE